MIWVNFSEQKHIDLRLNAPESEQILLEFNPLKMSDEPDWNPAWEEWHSYHEPLRIYQQDFKLLTDYFNRVYPTKDAFDGTPEPVFDTIDYNWIGKDDWMKIISEIEQELDDLSEEKQAFLITFLAWLKEALHHTSIIVVEGNS